MPLFAGVPRPEDNPHGCSGAFEGLPFLKDGRGDATDFQPALAIEPFANPFLGPVEPVFLEAERLVRRVA